MPGASAGALTVTGSTIAGNSAGDAGVNSSSAGHGGGIFAFGSTASLTVIASTISGNWAGNAAADMSSSGNDLVSNTIIASNTAGGNCSPNTSIDGDHNLTFGDVIATCPAGLATGDPGLQPLGNYGGPTKTLAILSPSAARDQIPESGAGCLPTDQRGVPRPQPGDMCDIGAFEMRRLSLNVSISGVGGESVTSSPPGIDCGVTCGAIFDEYATITLTADPNGASVFSGWSSGGCTGKGTCEVRLNTDDVVVAMFSLKPPDTKITRSQIKSNKGTATFKFRATGPTAAASTFECALVKPGKQPKFRTCKSPKAYEGLKSGKYTFEVRAKSAAGTDPKPAKKKFQVAG